ncbi:ATP-binding cassette domain-containing protein [Acinetobacter baumannii]
MSSLAQTKPNNQSTFLTKFFQQLRSYPARLKSYVIAFTSIAFWIVIWQGLAQFKVNLGFVNFSNVPTPLDVIHALWAFFQLSAAFEHVESSVFRVVVGFVLAALIGVGIGLLAGRYQKLAAFLMPPLEVLRPIPAVAWIPLAILIFPSSEASMIFITFIGALFPILLNTVHGVGAVDPRLVASGLKMKGIAKQKRIEQAQKMIDLVGLKGFEHKFPAELSGGMQQRVEIARVLINQPRILLMDEPFGALDAQTRLKMQMLLLEIWQEIQTSVLFITHDIDEALFLADRVLIMSHRPGRIIEEIPLKFERPRDVELVTSSEFTAIKKHCIQTLKEATQQEELSRLNPLGLGKKSQIKEYE